jgi:hypothetical protein
MKRACWHQFQVLAKRSERPAELSPQQEGKLSVKGLPFRPGAKVQVIVREEAKKIPASKRWGRMVLQEILVEDEHGEALRREKFDLSAEVVGKWDCIVTNRTTLWM